MQRIFYTSVDNEDGTLSTEFFYSAKTIDLLKEHYPNRYRDEDAGSFFVPKDFDIGLDIRYYEDVLEEIENDN